MDSAADFDFADDFLGLFPSTPKPAGAMAAAASDISRMLWQNDTDLPFPPKDFTVCSRCRPPGCIELRSFVLLKVVRVLRLGLVLQRAGRVDATILYHVACLPCMLIVCSLVNCLPTIPSWCTPVVMAHVFISSAALACQKQAPPAIAAMLHAAHGTVLRHLPACLSYPPCQVFTVIPSLRRHFCAAGMEGRRHQLA